MTVAFPDMHLSNTTFMDMKIVVPETIGNFLHNFINVLRYFDIDRVMVL